jgi:tetratricopeptide (TPR) repeat protein
MKLKKIISLLFLTFLVLQNNLKAQEDYEIDSLESLLPYANDLQRADILNGLANCIRDLDSAKAYRYAFQAYTISAKRSYCKGKANAILTLGLLEKNKGNLAQARIHYLNGLLLGLQCNELSAIAFAYNCLGNLSFLKSDYKKSIQYYIASVKISEQIGDRRRAAKTYNNIGSIMLELEKLRPAEEYFLRALDLYKGSDNKLVIAKIENNLANIYQNRGYDLKALYHYLNALEVFRAKSSASDVSAALGNIGLVYLKRNQVKKAMPFLHESFNLDLQINNPSSLMISISNLVEAYLLIGKYDSSLYYLNLGLQVNKANPNISKIAGLYDSAAELFGKLNVKNSRLERVDIISSEVKPCGPCYR